jgi:hypothetical protein
MKTTISEVIAARREAGEAYAVAAKAYVEAWIKLQGYDLACANGSVGLLASSRFGAQPAVLAHTDFLPDVAPLHRDLADRATAQHQQIIRGLNC